MAELKTTQIKTFCEDVLAFADKHAEDELFFTYDEFHHDAVKAIHQAIRTDHNEPLDDFAVKYLHLGQS